MAETAALTSAHSHARQATIEYQQVHVKDAAKEHHQASVDFARAARSTSDGEALRVLKLLEEQHSRLADIVRSQGTLSPESIQDTVKPSSSQPLDKDGTGISPLSQKASTAKGKATGTALASTGIGSQVRDSSPSLARDIASRRGIPQSGRIQPSPAAQVRAGQVSPDSRRRVQSASHSKIPPSIVDSQAKLPPARKSKKVEDDEGFAKFYSNLTTGTMSKLSSVLAYAGLPLTADESHSEQSTKKVSNRRTVSAGNDPDVKQIFSRAALDAIEDEHRQKGTFGHGFGPAESFYMVQRTGGTSLYADIVKTQQEQAAGLEDEEPEFVDVKEAPGPPSPVQSRFTHQQRGSFGSPRTQEELELENATLKQTLEQVAGRLAAFEVHAQDASMAAVTQSMASLRPEASFNHGDAAVKERLRQLERQVQQQAEDRQKLETHALKLEKMNRKWKSRWDDVQVRAKERTRAKRDSGNKTGDDDAGDGIAGE